MHPYGHNNIQNEARAFFSGVHEIIVIKAVIEPTMRATTYVLESNT